MRAARYPQWGISLQGRAAVARLAHNQEVAGANPAPATRSSKFRHAPMSLTVPDGKGGGVLPPLRRQSHFCISRAKRPAPPLCASPGISARSAFPSCRRCGLWPCFCGEGAATPAPVLQVVSCLETFHVYRNPPLLLCCRSSQHRSIRHEYGSIPAQVRNTGMVLRDVRPSCPRRLSRLNQVLSVTHHRHSRSHRRAASRWRQAVDRPRAGLSFRRRVRRASAIPSAANAALFPRRVRRIAYRGSERPCLPQNHQWGRSHSSRFRERELLK